MTGITELQLFLEQVPNRNPAAVWDQLCDAIKSLALPVAEVIDDDQTVQFAWDTRRCHIDIEIHSTEENAQMRLFCSISFWPHSPSGIGSSPGGLQFS